MSKLNLSALLRSALQIGGIVAVVHPQAIPMINALTGLIEPAGALAVAAGVVLGQIRASKTTKLRAAVDAAPTLPTATQVEKS